VNTPVPYVANINPGDVALLFLGGASIFWDDGGDGINWSDAANWSSNTLPLASDDVLISFGSGNVVSFNTTASIKSLISNDDLTIAGGTLTIANASTVNGNLALSGGTLTGAANVTVSGLTTWSAGTMSGLGKTVANGGLVFTGTGGKTLDRTLDHSAPGTVVWTGTGTVSGNGQFNHLAGTVDAQSAFNFDPSFNNQAILQKTTSTGVLSFNGAFANSGTIDIATGTFDVNTAAFANAATGVVQGTGALDVLGTTFTNNGVIRPGTSIGTLNVTGNVIFGTGSRLEVELGSSLASDRLAVTGNVTVDPGATLKILGAGGYTGNIGDVFPGVAGTTGTLTGTFDTVTQATDFDITPAYTVGPAGDLSLSVSNISGGGTTGGETTGDGSTGGGSTGVGSTGGGTTSGGSTGGGSTGVGATGGGTTGGGAQAPATETVQSVQDAGTESLLSLLSNSGATTQSSSGGSTGAGAGASTTFSGATETTESGDAGEKKEGAKTKPLMCIAS